MKVKVHISDERHANPYPFVTAYGSRDAKTEPYTVAELDGELTRAATVGFLRALADSLEES